MRTSTIVLGALATTSPALADGILGSLLHSLTSLGQSAVQELYLLEKKPPKDNPGFNAKDQFVDVSGIHAFQPPGPNDQRGPCPGLNALANHGYLPRNGLATILDLTSATTEVFNMGLDLAAILSAYGAALDGAGVGWSIGGQQHTGISGSRGNYESDSSPTRGDLNQYGSNVDLVLSQFKDLFNMQPDPATANYDLNVLFEFRAKRFNESVSKNPYFYYPPFAGVAVSQAAFSFIYRFMANHTEEKPTGILNQEVLKSFFAIEGEGDSMKWNPGHERIPENWYRRANGDGYGLFQLGDDMGVLFGVHPETSQPGCNQGRVNSYVRINATDTDGSHYDFSNPIDTVCFGIADVLKNTNVPIVSSVVSEVILPIQGALGCRTVPSLNQTVMQTCPGYSFWAGPTGDVVPGAVQN